MNDKKGVALALLVTFLFIVGDEVLDKSRAPKPKRVVSFAIVFLILGFMAEVQSVAKLAKYFSFLLMIGTIWAIGPQLYSKVQTSLNATNPKAKLALATPKKKGK